MTKTNPSSSLDLIDECTRRSVALLRDNIAPEGILASAFSHEAARRHYRNIFGRDAAICSLGMAVSGETDLVRAARRSIRTLGEAQADNGQIPNYVRPEIGERDFWYSGCIDATLWWLVALRLCPGLAGDRTFDRGFGRRAGRALDWLRCQEHQKWRLLQQNEASDWADIMPRSGFVLYANALWYWVKVLYELPDADVTRRHANLFFCPFGNTVPEDRRARLLIHYVRNKVRHCDLYLSYINFSSWGDEGDIFANIVAGLVGLVPPSRAGQIVESIAALRAHDPFPLRVVARPIRRGAPEWRPYMGRHRQNLPFQYHNGGIWPLAGAFWVMLLKRLGMEKYARRELARLAEANRLRNWEFNEWLHGRTGEPMGMPGQSWNAAGFLLARAVVEGRVTLGTGIVPTGTTPRRLSRKRSTASQP